MPQIHCTDLDRIQHAIWNNARFTEYFLNRYEVKNDIEFFAILDTLQNKPKEVDHLLAMLDVFDIT